MITSSLPPELKMVIATLILLVGGGIAWYCPVDREVAQARAASAKSSFTTVVNAHLSSSNQQIPDTVVESTADAQRVSKVYMEYGEYTENQNAKSLNGADTLPETASSDSPEYRLTGLHQTQSLHVNGDHENGDLVTTQGHASAISRQLGSHIDETVNSLSNIIVEIDDDLKNYTPFQPEKPVPSIALNQAFFEPVPQPPQMSISATAQQSLLTGLPPIAVSQASEQVSMMAGGSVSTSSISMNSIASPESATSQLTPIPVDMHPLLSTQNHDNGLQASRMTARIPTVLPQQPYQNPQPYQVRRPILQPEVISAQGNAVIVPRQKN